MFRGKFSFSLCYPRQRLLPIDTSMLKHATIHDISIYRLGIGLLQFCDIDILLLRSAFSLGTAGRKREDPKKRARRAPSFARRACALSNGGLRSYFETIKPGIYMRSRSLTAGSAGAYTWSRECVCHDVTHARPPTARASVRACVRACDAYHVGSWSYPTHRRWYPIVIHIEGTLVLRVDLAEKGKESRYLTPTHRAFVLAYSRTSRRQSRPVCKCARVRECAHTLGASLHCRKKHPRLTRRER